MNLIRTTVAFLFVVCSLLTASAKDFFDTSEVNQFFNLGVRVGVNTSNTTVDKDLFNTWNVDSWGTGFEAGVVANLNFRDYFSIQPGFFYEYRSGNYTYIHTDIYGDRQTQVGHNRRYVFTIPVVASFHFNITNDLRWNVDFGPYISFNTHAKENNLNVDYDALRPVTAELNGVDAGFKMGTGLNILRNYYVGVHYLAGVTNAWKNGVGGRNKAWTFTIGYDF